MLCLWYMFVPKLNNIYNVLNENEGQIHRRKLAINTCEQYFKYWIIRKASCNWLGVTVMCYSNFEQFHFEEPFTSVFLSSQCILTNIFLMILNDIVMLKWGQHKIGKVRVIFPFPFFNAFFESISVTNVIEPLR